MTTCENEWESRISDLYDRLNPKPIDPAERFIRNRLAESNASSELSRSYESELTNQFCNYLNGMVAYGLFHPEESHAYSRALEEWELAKKKNFPGFKRLYRIKEFFKEEGITSKDELEELFDTVTQLTVDF